MYVCHQFLSIDKMTAKEWMERFMSSREGGGWTYPDSVTYGFILSPGAWGFTHKISFNHPFHNFMHSVNYIN